MNLFTNTFNYRLCRKPKINQQQQRIVSRNASANSGLLLASSVLLLLLLLVGLLPSSADGFKILGRDTGENRKKVDHGLLSAIGHRAINGRW